MIELGLSKITEIYKISKVWDLMIVFVSENTNLA